MNEQKKMQEIRHYQLQLQNVLAQKQELMLEKAEIEEALQQIEKTTQQNVLKIVGNIIVARSKAEIKKELNDKKEFIEIKLKNLEKIEKKLIQNLSELQKGGAK